MNPVEFEKSPIEYSVLIYELGEPGDEIEAAVIRFEGTYGYGSLGNGDAIYMIAIRDYVIDCVLPCAIVFDLTLLHYEWGNGIWGLFGCDGIPVGTVTSEKCSGFETCAVAEPTFDSVELALQHLRPLAKEYERKILED